MKKIILFIILGVILVAGLGVGIYFIFKSNDIISTNAQTYVSISINPAVEFTANEDGIVISTVATDAEGDEIVQSFDFSGMTVESACEKFTQLCINAGYVSYENDEESADPNEVKITVINQIEDVQEDIVNKIKLKLNNCFQNNGIFGFVSIDTLAEYAEQAQEFGISVGHIKLIMSALYYNPELTFEDLVEMPINEVVKLVKVSHENMQRTTQAIRAQLKLDLEGLKTNEEYANMFTALEVIQQIQISLNDDTLTEQQRAQFEALFAQAKINFNQSFRLIFEEYKQVKSSLIEQAKEDSQELLEQIRSQYEQKVENNRQNSQNAKNNSNNVKNRIRDWQQAQEEID
ncbi:MAG: hypothetical protein EOM55_02875 [Clostridia bacterium]|nr:hypothetical protein [Clostridia bacterium]